MRKYNFIKTFKMIKKNAMRKKKPTMKCFNIFI